MLLKFTEFTNHTKSFVHANVAFFCRVKCYSVDLHAYISTAGQSYNVQIDPLHSSFQMGNFICNDLSLGDREWEKTQEMYNRTHL